MTAPLDRERLQAVQFAFARFERTARAELLRVYRLHLQATVTTASPLAIDLAAGAGLDLPRVAAMLPVPKDWPPGVLPPRRRKGARQSFRLRQPTSTRSQPNVSIETSLRLGRSGVAIRDAANPRGDLGFVPEDGCLEAVSSTRDVMMYTSRGRGCVIIRGNLPETTLLAMQGRPVDCLISHPALDDRGYVVEEACVDEFMGDSVLRFRTGLLPLVLPWADELAEEVARNRTLMATIMGHKAGVLERYSGLGAAPHGAGASAES